MTSKQNDTDKTDEILTYQPLSADNAVSANPHIPSVSASAVLGESESVSFLYRVGYVYSDISLRTSYAQLLNKTYLSYTFHTLYRCQMIIQYAKDMTLKHHQTLLMQ